MYKLYKQLPDGSLVVVLSSGLNNVTTSPQCPAAMMLVAEVEQMCGVGESVVWKLIKD